jgi:hypothetical protein
MTLLSRLAPRGHQIRSPVIAVCFLQVQDSIAQSRGGAHCRNALFSSSTFNVKTITPTIVDDLKKTLEVAVPAVLLRRKSSFPGVSSVSINQDAIHHLALLNGYHEIQIDNLHHQQVVQLAEGVIAEASNTLAQEYTLYGRRPTQTTITIDDSITNKGAKSASAKRKSNTSMSKRKHPSFRDEDFTLFRTLQSSVEDKLNAQENRIREQISRKVEQANESYTKAVDAVYYKPVSKLTGDGSSKQKGKQEATVPPEEMNVQTQQFVGNENLLIVSKSREGRVLLVENVPPEYRLLVLPQWGKKPPYRLRHGRTASVIYTGLVLFGATPLAYRSLKYALDYPGLAQVMVASVIGSVSYSAWASRVGARTRQSLVVTSATASRIVAQDEAAITILRQQGGEGAKVLVEAVMAAYLAKLDEPSFRDKEQGVRSKRDLPLSVDPVIDLAVELGLLERTNSGIVATPWDEASLDIMKRATAQIHHLHSTSRF